MMQESPRLPPMLNPGWTPPTISNNSVGGAGRRGTGKRARGTGILNGHHGKPLSSVHPHQMPQSTQDTPHPQSQVPSPAPPSTSPQQPSSIPPQTPMSLRDTPKLQGTPKRPSGAVPVSSSTDSSSHTNQTKSKDLWGGWLGTSLNLQRNHGEAAKQRNSASPLHSSEIRTSGYDMTKLYPELSAKLGLTKPAPSENTTASSHKNGLTMKEHLNSGCLKKLEDVTEGSRIKIISTGQIVSNSRGILAAKIGNGISTNKSSSSSSSSKSYNKQKHKYSDRGPRKDSHGRSSVRSDSSSDRSSKRDGHSRVRLETSDKLPKKDSHSRSSGGRSDSGDRGGSRKEHSRSMSGRGEYTSSGGLHASSHGLSRSPSKGPSSFGSKSTGADSVDRKNHISSVTSSILEEQLRGGPSPRQPLGLSSPTIGSPLHSRLADVGLNKSVSSSAPLAISTASSCSSRSLVMAPATYPPSVAAHQPRVVTLPPRRLPQLAVTRDAAASLPESLLRVHTLRKKYYAYNSDLFPLGVETSEESDISDVDDMCGSQQGWIDPTVWDTRQNWVTRSAMDLSQPSSGSNCQRSVLLAATLASHRRQVAASRLRSEGRAWEVERKSPLTHSLVDAARTHPRLTAEACSLYRTSQTNQESPKMKHRFKSSVLVHRVCAYDDGEGKGECGEPSLPGTRHCLRHIMYNVDQLLFTHCTARLSDNTLCRVPVFDLSHELPLCAEHSKKKDTCIRTIPEETPKPKRPRKKNKMPILSRYGKRSKKRRRSSNSTSSIIPSTSVRPPMASQSSLSSPQPSPSTPQTSPHFSTTSCTDSLAEAEDSDLEADMVEAASRLLDPHALQDVLNRIPDHELTQLFDAPEGKSGEFDGHSDEKEEMEGHREADVEVRRDGPPQPPRLSASTTALVAASTTTITTSATPPLTEEGTTLSLDESTLNELVAGNIPIDNIISSSFNQQELNTISQALSNFVQESNMNLAGFDLSATNSFPASDIGSNCAVGDVSDSSLMSHSSDAAGQTEFCEPETQVVECKGNLISQRSGLVTDAATLSPLK